MRMEEEEPLTKTRAEGGQTEPVEGLRIHYNFVRPHAALEGQTPAERAGVGIQGENKWLSLMKASLKPKEGTTN